MWILHRGSISYNVASLFRASKSSSFGRMHKYRLNHLHRPSSSTSSAFTMSHLIPCTMLSTVRAAVRSSRYISQPLRSVCRPVNSVRTFSSTRPCTSALNNILASEDDPVKLQVDRLTPRGFHLSDDLLVPGGLLLIDGQPFLWDVNPPNLKASTLPGFWAGWTPEAFKVFEVVLPRPGELSWSSDSRWKEGCGRDLARY